MTDRIHEGLQWLASEFSVTREDFRQEHKAGGDMLLDGLLSQGYAMQRNGRFAVSDMGRRYLAAMAQEPEEADA